MNKVKSYSTGYYLYELNEEERYIFLDAKYILLDTDIRKTDNVRFVSDYIKDEIWRYNPFCETVREADLTVEAINYRTEVETLRYEMNKMVEKLNESIQKTNRTAEFLKKIEEDPLKKSRIGTTVKTLYPHTDLSGSIDAATDVEIVNISQHGYTIRDLSTGTTVKDIGFII